MAETLGSLCDKLTVVKLKQYHSEDKKKLESLAQQEKSLIDEIDEYIFNALNNEIPLAKLSFAANKVFKEEGNEIKEVKGSLAEVFSTLANVNCLLWHEQEKVYEFEKVPSKEKDIVVKRLAILNLQRNKCMDEINNLLISFVVNRNL